MKFKIAQLLIVLSAISSTLCLAEVNPSLPPVKLQGQTEFMSGGIGEEEAEAIRQAQSSWTLMLELSQAADSKAEYISDVQITIKDELGNTVLDTVTEGPYLLVSLPEGKYSLEATYKSITLHRDLRIQKNPGKKITLVWR